MAAKGRVLVTGASGFLGRRLVEMLVARGHAVRALVRKTSKLDGLQLPGVEIACGDIADAADLKQAFDGLDYVVHAAADTSGTEAGARRVTIGGTRNILDLCVDMKVKRLVYISSCSVYGVAGCHPGQVLDETAKIEPFPERRGLYTWGKQEAEKLVLESMRLGLVSAVCLRPGTIYGCGGENYTPMIGFSLKKKLFIVFTNDELVLPLVYVDNLVEAILVAMTSARGSGQVYNVVDPLGVNKKQYIDLLIRRLYRGVPVVYLPYGLLEYVVAVQERLFYLFKCRPILSQYRLDSSQKPIVYDSSRLVDELEWQPRMKFAEAVEVILASQSGGCD